uniref:Uncharacterized protein n=1 Tax=viral metagenome TaxID=1070528 RepID=A0A6M3IN49_9ZZZZ
MRNVKIEATKKTIVITIDRESTEWTSGSGKSLMLASTEGNVEVPGTEYKVGLNLYRKNEQ